MKPIAKVSTIKKYPHPDPPEPDVGKWPSGGGGRGK